MAEKSERQKLAEERREIIEALGGQAFFPDVGTLSLADLEPVAPAGTQEVEVDK